MIDADGVERLRELVTSLQDASTDKMPDWKRGQQDSYTLGFDDGQVQAGNDLESLLDELNGVQPRPDA